jgi:predicted SnoaL-like aldol condensation-catalyzing enzyme
MSSNQKESAASFLRLVAEGKVDEAYSKFVGASFRHHNQFFEGTAKALQAAMEENARQNPSKVFEVKRMIAEGDLVVTHSHVRQKAEDLGVAVIHIFRFENGKIVELWDLGQSIQDASVNKNGMF